MYEQLSGAAARHRMGSRLKRFYLRLIGKECYWRFAGHSRLAECG